MFSKILIANRGEIALRVIRACRESGIRSVAVHSTADSEAMHVRMADESVCIGPPSPARSYLSIAAIISACEVTGADAVHPGYGFLSENADFIQTLEDHGIAFIGPRPNDVRMMGDKIAAKQRMMALGVPTVPGSDGVTDDQQAGRIAADIGYPVIVKAAAGGGGRGMKVVHDESGLAESLSTARREAALAFGNDAVYLEKYLAAPKHIEVQIVGDGRGKAVHLGERDCSLQRRHQKILEEAPAPLLDRETRHRIGTLCAEAVASMHYSGVGTIEFLYQDDAFYFIEMNTRLQVEHPVTEAVCGVDLVREQIAVAAGEGLSVSDDQPRISGHAIEVRINAERLPDFQPSPGQITGFHAPGGPGVRMDSAVYAGCTIPPNYDSLIGKLIVHGQDRANAITKLRGALSEMVIEGIATNADLFLALLDEDAIRDGSYGIHWLETWLAGQNA